MAAIGTDAGGRCHDGEHGGLELVDLSEPDEPELLWLTRQTGENHNTTYDPWNNVLLTSTSDRNAFIDILDLNSCAPSCKAATAPAGSSRPATSSPTG